jgi:hypothetical protein
VYAAAKRAGKVSRRSVRMAAARSLSSFTSGSSVSAKRARFQRAILGWLAKA